MAAFDASSFFSGSGAGPVTGAHTCSGSDRALCVNVHIYDSGDSPTGVTYNGVALSFIGSASNGQYSVYQFYLIAPASGANTVSVTLSGPVFDVGVSVVSMTGVHQSTAIGTSASASGSDTTPTVDVSSAVSDLVLDGLVMVHSGTLSVGAGQTARVNAVTGNAFIKYASSTEDGASTTTMSWSNTTSQAWAIMSTPFKSSSGAPPGQAVAKRFGGVPYLNSSFSPRIW
mgnify:FL=1